MTQGSFTTQGAFTAAGQAVAGSFVLLGDSALSGITMPTVYEVDAVDTTGWVGYDVTCECAGASCAVDAAGDGCTPASGTAAFPNTWGISPLNSSGTADNTSALRTMLQQQGDEHYLYFPNGTYDIEDSPDGSAFFRPSPTYDRRGIICESQSATINVVNGVTSPVDIIFLEGEDMVYNAAATSWNSGSGGSAGDTVITVASTSGFSTTITAAGGWAHLTADPNSTGQDNSQRQWFSPVTAIGAGTITIRDPLPEDFDGGNAQARAWTPTLDWVVRDCTIAYEDASHATVLGALPISTKSMARYEITGNAIEGSYQKYINIEKSADGLVAHNDMTGILWDKATNGYGLTISESSRVWVHDNVILHATPIAFSNGSQNVLVTYNALRAPAANASFDVQCTEADDSGDNNNCVIVSHSGFGHPATVSAATANASCNALDDPMDCCTGAGTGTCSDSYLHCSTQAKDTLGEDGDASCRGTAGSAIYSCFEFHDRSASNTLVMRNLCDGQVWMDASFGAGRGNFIFGNRMTDDSAAENFNTSPGGPSWQGGFYFRNIGTPNGGNYRQDFTWANNLFESNFGSSAAGYNKWGGGVSVLDNVIAGGCWDHDADNTGGGPDGGVCTHVSTTNGDASTTWTNNAVGVTVHGSPRTMPTLPGFTSMPTFTHSTGESLPYIGPEMGDAASTTACVPAWVRYNGSC